MALGTRQFADTGGVDPRTKGLLPKQSGQYPIAAAAPAPEPMPPPPTGGMGGPGPVPAVEGGGLPPVDVAPPSMEALDFGGGVGHESAAQEVLAGPEEMRQGIGQRIPPSLAALLRYRVY